MHPLAIYIHVPFCVKKCSYCDFNAYSGMGDLAASYVSAVRQEIRRSPYRGRCVHTVFFGGGTPTYLSAGQLAAILGEIRDAFQIDSGAEVSAEANPTSVDAAKFAAMRDAGFNRLSIGVQSFNDLLLKRVDREHSADEAEEAVRRARVAGFRNLSIDLMFALPGQSLEQWEATLDRALSLETEHLSVYALTIEPGTRFERLHAGGKLDLPDEDAELAMYERAVERITAAGFEHYEVSNFARPGFRARHNLVYWCNEEYAGFGPGAVSYVDGCRWTNEKYPARYIEKVEAGQDLAIESERLAPAAAMSETLIQGLRLREGISLDRLGDRYGLDAATQYDEPLRKLEGRGLVELRDGRIRLTDAGLLLANDVALELLP